MYAKKDIKKDSKSPLGRSLKRTYTVEAMAEQYGIDYSQDSIDRICTAKVKVLQSNSQDFVEVDEVQYPIFKNPATDGLMCIFVYEGKYYTADLSFVPPIMQYELMIFHSDDTGYIDDWNPLYTAHFNKLKVQHVIDSVQAFIQDND